MSHRTVGKLLEQYLAAKEKERSGERIDREDRRRIRGHRDRLLVNYSPLVKYAVGKVSARATQPARQEELMSWGIFGLLDAIETYDPGQEAKFETYAISKIRWAILDEFRREDRVPRRVRSHIQDIERSKGELSQKLKRAPNEGEIAHKLNVSVHEYRKIVHRYALAQVDSLDARAEATDSGFGLQISSGEAENPSVSLEKEEIRGQLVAAMQDLDDRERTVVTLYFYEGLTLREIGQALQLTEGRISQIMSRTLKKLRGILSADDLVFHTL